MTSHETALSMRPSRRTLRRACLSSILLVAAACGSSSSSSSPDPSTGAGGDSAMGGDGGSAGAGGAAGTGGAGVSGGGTSSVGGAGGGGAGGAGGGQSGGSAGATGGSGGASVGGSGGSGGSAGAGGAGAGGSGGGSTGGSATGGAGAGGAAGGASGGTAGTSSGGFGANGGFGGACDPLDTTSCPGQRCGLVGSQFGCEPAGPDGDQAACTFDAMGFDSCQAGFTCILEPKTCYRVCDPTKMVADCAADEKCNYTINVTNGPSFHVCHPKPLQCDPLTQDCTDPSKACYPVPGGNECHTLGTKADGDACTFANDCMKGSVCENILAKQACYHMCNVMGGAPTCSTGTCMMVSGATYGLCL